MSHRTDLWPVFTLITLILGAFWTWTSSPADGIVVRNISAPQEGFSAPKFTLATLSGDSIVLSELNGKPVLINFWASWCPPCKAEMPAIESFYQTYQDQGLIVLAVNTTYQDDLAATVQFTKDNNLTFPVLLDHDGQVSRLYQVRALPTSFFIDSEGIIQAVVVGGPMSETLIRSQADRILQGVP